MYINFAIIVLQLKKKYCSYLENGSYLAVAAAAAAACDVTIT